MTTHNNCVPLFTSHYSIGKSILTLDSPDELSKSDPEMVDNYGFKENYPVSIFSIAKKHDLKEIYLVETNFSGFITAYKTATKLGISLRFGIKLIVCNDITDKTNESLNTESKIIVWMLNSDGYADLLKLYSFAATDGFYYVPRIDWKSLHKFLTSNLYLTIPFYDNFLFQNLLTMSVCVPELRNIQPVFFLENHALPFDSLAQHKITEYAAANHCDIQLAHSIYYYKNADVLPYQVYRIITRRGYERGDIFVPNLDHFGSDQFSFESYLTQYGR